jgi:hypothetical protein
MLGGYIKAKDLVQKNSVLMNHVILKIISSPKASLSNTGTALLRPRSNMLRLRPEMPCS